MVDSIPLVAALDRAGLRLTEPRRVVARLVAEQSGHFTAADLVHDARARRFEIGRATIFRTLEVFLGLGLVERIDLPNGDHAYLRCAPAHHHHVVCSRCGRAAEVEDSGLRTMVREVVLRTGYRVDEHKLELFGLCPDCLASAPVPLDQTARPQDHRGST